MSSLTARLLCVVGVILLVGGGGAARGQERTPAATAPAASATDPRVGLKPGLKDAGQAARNLELVSSLPKPAGFFDPKQPAGEPTGPETEEKPDPKPGEKPSEKQRRQAGDEAIVRRRRLELREFGPGVQRQTPVHRQLQRVQRLRSREPEEAEAACVDRLSGRPGRFVRARQPARHVSGADPRPDRLRNRGRSRRR